MRTLLQTLLLALASAGIYCATRPELTGLHGVGDQNWNLASGCGAQKIRPEFRLENNNG